VVVLAGCGEKGEPKTATPGPKARTADAGPGGGGDEEPIRQRVAITVGKRAIRPARVQVDAFLGIRLLIRNASGREQLIEVRGAKPPRGLQVGPGVRANLDLEGLRPGRYRIQGEPTKARGTLVVKRTEP
jgi:hypothetical protein